MVCHQLTQKVVENYMKNLLSVVANDAPLFPTFSENDLITILHSVQDVYAEEPIMLEFDLPANGLVVVGDLHGDMYCLLKILLDNGFPPNSNYLFMGDYVDRGMYQVQLILFIFLMKLRWPNHVTTLKGNHEDYQCGKDYQFYDECLRMFKKKPRWYTRINHVFDHMPVCAIISNYFFACHGGISQWLTCRNNVKNIAKPTYTNNMHFLEGVLLADLLWADPIAGQGKRFAVSSRNCGFTFNKQALHMVLDALDVTTLIRAHEYYPGGTARNFNDDSCYTVHSTGDEHEAYSGTLKLEEMDGTFAVVERSELIPPEAHAKPLAYQIQTEMNDSFASTSISYSRNGCRWCEQPHPLYVTRRKRLYAYNDIWRYMAKEGRFMLEYDVSYCDFCSQGSREKALRRAVQLFPVTFDINSERFDHFLRDGPLSLRIYISEDEYDLMEKIYAIMKRDSKALPEPNLRHFSKIYKQFPMPRSAKGRFKRLKKRIQRAMGLMPCKIKSGNMISIPITLPLVAQREREELLNEITQTEGQMVEAAADRCNEKKENDQELDEVAGPLFCVPPFDSTPFYMRAPGATFSAPGCAKLFDAHENHPNLE